MAIFSRMEGLCALAEGTISPRPQDREEARVEDRGLSLTFGRETDNEPIALGCVKRPHGGSRADTSYRAMAHRPWSFG